MKQADRRIRSLKIRGRENDLLPARYLLEEAFRIASLPGLPPNALVLIRRLDLGRIHANLSPGRLAGIISENVSNLAAEAVCIDQQSGVDAGVVWFSDPLRPYQVLLQRLLDGKAANEWYWALLFPGQRLSLNEQLISELMIKACQMPAQGLAVSLLIQACLEPIRLSRLFPFITPAVVRRLLHEQGMTPRVLSGFTEQQPYRQETVFSETGKERLIDAPDLNVAWRYAVQVAAGYWGHNDVRTRWLALQALFCYRPGYVERRDTWQRIAVSHWLEAWSASTSVENREQSNSSGAKSQKCASDAVPGEVQEPVSTGKSNGSEPKPQRYASDDVPGEARELASTNSSIESLKEPLQDKFESTRGSAQIHTQGEPWNAGSVNEACAARPGQFTRDSGFALLIPLLQRLGIAELLQRYDVLPDLDFPRQLLWAMAIRFKLEENDPVWRLFEETEKTPSAVIEHFSAPSAWRQLVQLSTVQPRYFPMQAANMRMEQLITRFQLAGAMFLRRHCALSLRALIHRPGRVVQSETHWDVMFDINQTDLRLRRMALDSDPGWVPWLGKVVQFHYVSEGQGYE